MLTAEQIRSNPFMQVTWTDSETGVRHYGMPHRYDDRYPLDEYLAKNQLIVSNVLLPGLHVVNLSEVEEADYRDVDEFMELELAKALNQAKKHSPSDNKLYKGDLIAVGVADGCAWYVVTKVHRKNADIEWRGLSPDRWVDQRYGYGGRFPISQLLPFAKGQRADLAALKPLISAPGR